MEHYLAVYQQNPLFDSVDRKALIPLLNCLHAEKRHCVRGTVIFREGEPATHLGIVLSGRVNTVFDNLLGERNIVDSLGAGQLFCESFASAQIGRLPISVVMQEEGDLLIMNCSSVLHPCEKGCPQHKALAENLLHIMAFKYVALNHKLLVLSGRSTRRKLLSYLSHQAHLAGSNRFTIPFNRQELADYLFVERSALSSELGRLKREGVIDFYRCEFQLLGSNVQSRLPES